MDGSEPSPPALLNYAEAFNAHVVASRRYARATASPAGADWPARSPGRFFAALARHSRWRPDLIAADVGVPELSVRAYIDALEAGVTRRAVRTFRRREGMAPAAREVDGAWLETEERLAAALAARWEAADADADAERTRKRRFRAKQRARAPHLAAPLVGAGPGPARAEARAAGAEGYSDASYYRAKKAARAEVARLARRWELQDVGGRLGADELDALDAVLAPAWSGWLCDLVDTGASAGQGRGSDSSEGARGDQAATGDQDGGAEDDNDRGSGGSDDDGDDEDDGSETSATEQQQERPRKRRRGEPSKKTLAIVNDDRELDALSAAPSASLSAAQLARLSALRNKKAARERYRMKKLLAQGYAQASIELAGGPDAVFARLESGGHVLKLSGKRRRSNMHGEATSATPDLPPAPDSGSRPAAVPLEEDPLAHAGQSESSDTAGPSVAAQRLAALDAHVYFAQRGWDVFNYERMSQLLIHYHPSERATVSFALLKRLYAGLFGHLTRLVHDVVALAEADELTGSPAEVTHAHVSSVLALHGERPDALIAEHCAAVDSSGTAGPDEQDSNRDEQGRVGSSGPDDNGVPEPARDTAWALSWADAVQPLPLNQADEGNAEGDDGGDGDSDGATDDAEAAELDEALQAVDEAYDRLLLARLRSVATAGADEYDDAFGRPLGKLKEGHRQVDAAMATLDAARAARGKRRDRTADAADALTAIGFASEGPGELAEAADGARLGYIERLQAANERRHERDASSARSHRFKWFRIKREYARLGRYRTAAVVVSDSDGEGGGSDCGDRPRGAVRRRDEGEMSDRETTDDDEAVVHDDTSGESLDDDDDKDDELADADSFDSGSNA